MQRLTRITHAIRNWFNPPKTEKEIELENAQTALIEKQLKEPDNPYINTNAVLATIAKEAEKKEAYYKRMTRLWITLTMFFASAYFISATSVRVKPYVVGMNQNAQIFDLSHSMKNVKDSDVRNKLALSQANSFVEKAFSVSPDGDVDNSNQEFAYAVTRGNASVFIKDYYSKNDAHEIANKYSVTVEFKYTRRLSAQTIEVSWIETKKNPKTNAVVSRQAYNGQFTYHWDTRAGDDVLDRLNPLGFYIDNISIEKDNTFKNK